MTMLTGTMTATSATCEGHTARNVHDLCRLLDDNGHSLSALTLLDAVTGIPRLRVSWVCLAALECVRETANEGPRFAKWAPLPEGAFAKGEAA